MPLTEIIKVVDSTVQAVTISAMGGIAHYFYEIQKGQAFKVGTFLINIVLAGWLGYIVMGFVPTDSKLFGPILSIAGFCTYPFLRIIEEKAPEVWKRVFENPQK